MSRFLYWLLARDNVEQWLIDHGFGYDFSRRCENRGPWRYSVRIYRRSLP